MKLSLLALFLAVAAGCSEPDVSGFDGSKAQPSAGDDDDDGDDSSTSAQSSKKGDDVLLDDDDDDDGKKKDDKKKDDEPASTDEPKQTPAECYAACLAPIPEAAALNECSNKCPDNDAECLDECFTQSGCGDNSKCTPALTQCGLRCPGADAQ